MAIEDQGAEWMTRDEYMEAHHHATESAIGLINVFMMAEDYDKVNEILTKCRDELDRISKLRFESFRVDRPERPHVTEYRDCGGVSVV